MGPSRRGKILNIPSIWSALLPAIILDLSFTRDERMRQPKLLSRTGHNLRNGNAPKGKLTRRKRKPTTSKLRGRKTRKLFIRSTRRRSQRVLEFFNKLNGGLRK